MSNVSEKEYVNDVYDSIAEDFSRTRTRVWERVKIFIDSIKENSNCIDIGCGNGKNMYRRDLNTTGVDMCDKFVNICKQKSLNVRKMDCCELLFDNSVFDAAISIAVFHHLSTYERRIKAFSEVIRILKPQGIGLISLWSFENQTNQSFVKGDNMVSWKHVKKNLTFNRYYYIFDEKSLNDYLFDFKNKVNIISKFNDHGNWYIIFKKL